MILRRLKSWLLQRASQPRRNLAWVASGALLFFLGIALVYWAELRLPARLTGEWLALLGIGLSLIGGLISLIGYLSLSIFRLIKFWNDN